MRHFTLYISFLCSITAAGIRAQVSCNPVFPNAGDNVTITYNAALGNGALNGVSPVYGHFGVITSASQSPSDWKHVVTTWGVNNANAQMTNAGPNLWTKTFNINTFFGIQPGETVLKLAFVFRNGSGSVVGRAADGSDIFYEVYPDNTPLQTLFLSPSSSAFLATQGQTIDIKAAASAPADLSLFDNGAPIANAANAEQLQHALSVSGNGTHVVEFVAQTATEKDTTRFTYIVANNIVQQDPPPGTEAGITILDQQTVRLALYAPGKQIVHAIGDFSNWQVQSVYQMKRSADGNLWWIDIAGIQPGQPVRFQYLVDASLKIADPLSTLVLDPWNDGVIPAFTYPDIPPYPAGLTTGIVSVFTTGEAPFNWTASNYQRPKKTDLVVYELLVRDFIARHDYPTLLDTLDYLEKLGVTAIELMPVNEFDGNLSWGYNPAYHKSIDKYYGTAEALKTVVDECHKRGIAVILDVVFNHATGASPLAQLYWDNANNRPAANNPWLNPTAKHDFNVFNDFNHESQATKNYVKNCLKYWMTEFRMDGFRFDLSKGFTQKNTVGNVAAWGAYDATRVAIWKNYADYMWAIDPGCYVILEHFADNTEEKELANYGMMLWGNMWGAYKETALGFSNTQNMTGISYKQRGWNQPHLVGYMESHDEDRIGYECKTYGSQIANHNVRTLPVYTQRIAMLENLLFTVPGPKMLWQFGEMAYDYTINYCEDGTINNNCRTYPKPIRWDYLNDPYRRKLQQVTSALLQLRKNYDVFETTDFQLNLVSGQVRSIYLNSPDMHVAIFANIGVSGATVSSASFQHSGEWFEYYTGTSKQVSANNTASLSFAPGQYYLFTDQYVPLPPDVTLGASPEPAGALDYLSLSPNPAAAEVSIQFSIAESAALRCVVTDLQGRMVWQQQFDELPFGEYQSTIDVSTLPAGMYMLRLTDPKGYGLTRKLVKQ